MRAEKVRVEANCCNPARDEPSILPCSHAAVAIATATEQRFARFLASGFDVIVDRLPRLLRPKGVTGQPLPRDLRKSLKQRSTLLHLFFANRGEEKIVQVRMKQGKSSG
jgi:hypothetical protein